MFIHATIPVSCICWSEVKSSAWRANMTRSNNFWSDVDHQHTLQLCSDVSWCLSCVDLFLGLRWGQSSLSAGWSPGLATYCQTSATLSGCMISSWPAIHWCPSTLLLWWVSSNQQPYLQFSRTCLETLRLFLSLGIKALHLLGNVLNVF